MKVTLKLSPHRAQHVAALAAFWKVYDSEEQDMEAFGLQPFAAFIYWLMVEINMIPGIWDDLSDIAETHGWKDVERDALLRLKDDHAMSQKQCEEVLAMFDAKIMGKGGDFGFRPPVAHDSDQRNNSEA